MSSDTNQIKIVCQIRRNIITVTNCFRWFHSHPTFAPEPSHQDLETQQSVQQWIGQNKPCIGMILSPFSLNGALIASPFRCLIVDRKINFEDQLVPYKFKVDIVEGGFQIGEFLSNLRKVIKCDFGTGEKHRVDFSKPYFHESSITFLEKVSFRLSKNNFCIFFFCFH